MNAEENGMTDDRALEERIRDRAYAIWESEGRPEGRAEFNWDQAKEIVALEDAGEPLIDVEDSVETPVEPAVAFENMGAVPGLDDQVEGGAGPERDNLADEARLPLSHDER